MINSFVNKFKFRNDVRNIVSRDFSIISSNCIGGLIYKTLGIPYNSPTAGLFLHAPCFLRLLGNIDSYLSMTPRLTKRSRYLENPSYPIGIIGDDVEIHFLHYPIGSKAVDAWLRRVERVNLKSLFITMTDRDGFTPQSGEIFDSLPFNNKIIFSSRQLTIPSCITISAYKEQATIGNIYTDYNNFVGDFSFSRWINGAR